MESHPVNASDAYIFAPGEVRSFLLDANNSHHSASALTRIFDTNYSLCQKYEQALVQDLYKGGC